LKRAGKAALVAGAGSGIGESIARRFAAEESRIRVASRRAENTRQVAASVVALDGNAEARVLDLSDPGQQRPAWPRSSKLMGSLT
jgi:NAD(P)-dependent dehydrogenase (short-subunit alcohol dehydrogenase family)